MPPRCVQASASFKILRFSSAANRRRIAFADTSVSCAASIIVADSSLALDTKLRGADCLSYVGREGVNVSDYLEILRW